MGIDNTKSVSPESSCDWEPSEPGPTEGGSSRLYKFQGDFTWQGVETETYKLPSATWCGVLRRTLVGKKGERASFQVRYFEIEPGGFSSLEKHTHEHVVIPIRGCAKAIVGTQCYEVAFLDTLYIAPEAAHQFVNDGREPFGFLCIVDAERDRPRPVSEEELAGILNSDETKKVVKLGSNR